jgi:hypothetical protein
VADLIAAAADSGLSEDDEMRTGNLLLTAGDADRALAVFRRVLARTADSPRALQGAGAAAFALGQFNAALRYLTAAPDTPEIIEMRAVSRAVLTSDPLAPRLGLNERRRRASRNLDALMRELDSCRTSLTDPDAMRAAEATAVQLAAAAAMIPRGDGEVIEDSLAAVTSAEQTLRRYCGSGDPMDRALTRIAAMHDDLP